jgi:hypothetical protein
MWCNDREREGAKLSPELVSGLFFTVPLAPHSVRHRERVVRVHIQLRHACLQAPGKCFDEWRMCC